MCLWFWFASATHIKMSRLHIILTRASSLATPGLGWNSLVLYDRKNKQMTLCGAAEENESMHLHVHALVYSPKSPTCRVA